MDLTRDEAISVQTDLLGQGGMSNPIFLDFLSLVKTKNRPFMWLQMVFFECFSEEPPL